MEGLAGSLRPAALGKIISSLAAHAGLTSASRVIDVGAGTGRALLQFSLAPGVASSWGVELDRAKTDKAAPVCAAALGALGRQVVGAAPQIRCCDVANLGTAYPASHLFSFWEAMHPAARAATGRLFARSASLVAAAVVQRP